MVYENGRMKDLKIAYIGGGSRGWAWTFMTDLALEESLGGTIRLYDIDEATARSNEIIGNNLSKRPDAVGKWHYVTCKSLEEALTGSDFIVISILPGTFDEMDSDVHYPEKYGIYQSVGDTAGPGGIVRALRTVPMFVEIAEGIKAYSPDAWVINYTNPMTLCVKVLYQVFPEIKAFGCCHEVFGTQKVLKGICEEALGLTDVDRRDILVNVLGINHFTWFNEASYKGIDLFPVYRDYVEAHYQEGYNEPDKNWANGTFHCAHRVKFDLFKRYGLIAAAGDRHLAEFMPGDEYLKNPDVIRSWKFGLTTVDWRKADLAERLAKSARLVKGEEEISLEPTGEEGILLIKALCGLVRVVSNVNIPNTGLQIPNLPATAVVETNAVFSKNSIKPLIAGNIPGEVLSLILPHIKNHEDVLAASFNYDRGLIYKAAARDPLVAGKLTMAQIKEMMDAMIDNTLAFLPEGWR